MTEILLERFGCGESIARHLRPRLFTSTHPARQTRSTLQWSPRRRGAFQQPQLPEGVLLSSLLHRHASGAWATVLDPPLIGARYACSAALNAQNWRLNRQNSY